MLEVFFQGLFMVFEFHAFVALLIGILCGITIGIIPGLGGGIGIVLLLPFTFGMDSTAAFALFSKFPGNPVGCDKFNNNAGPLAVPPVPPLP